MVYEDRCGSCYWLRSMSSDSYLYNQSCSDRGHCIERGICPYPDETTCSDYKNRETYSNSNYSASSQNTSSGCYITTIVCELVGFSDNCKILETLRAFRNKMQQDPKYREILFEYDTVGPQIAKNLKENKEFDLANGMLDAYIFPTVYLLREGKEEEAVKKYVTMTKALEDYYGIRPEEFAPMNYDQKNGGHGKVLTI